MWEAAAVLGGAGLILGTGLAYVAVKVAVPPDPRVQAVRNALPGANCGACGYPGCDGAAAAVVAGEVSPSVCAAGGSDTAAAVAAVLGVEVSTEAPKVMVVHCQGSVSAAARNYRYEGMQDCRAAAAMPDGGPKACTYGCLGLGTCVSVCPFGALSMDEERGLPVVDREKCTACGVCAEACPKGILGLEPKFQGTVVACRSLDKGPVVRKVCKAGCLGCGLCVRSCPVKAIKLVDKLAVIDPEICIGCGMCVEKCPTKAIAEF